MIFPSTKSTNIVWRIISCLKMCCVQLVCSVWCCVFPTLASVCCTEQPAIRITKAANRCSSCSPQVRYTPYTWQGIMMVYAFGHQQPAVTRSWLSSVMIALHQFHKTASSSMRPFMLTTHRCNLYIKQLVLTQFLFDKGSK